MARRKTNPPKYPNKFYKGPTLYHVVKEFQDGKHRIVVYKFWSKGYQSWQYKTDYLDMFLHSFEIGYYRKDKDPYYKKQKLNL